MRVAVTYKEGNVFQHFGSSEHFKLYDVEENAITKEAILDTDGNGHGALADLLKDHQVDTVICGGIGEGAKQTLSNAEIRLFGGVTGKADEAVNALINGRLQYDLNVTCRHHEGDQDNHSCAAHREETH